MWLSIGYLKKIKIMLGTMKKISMHLFYYRVGLHQCTLYYMNCQSSAWSFLQEEGMIVQNLRNKGKILLFILFYISGNKLS